jgi:hypothetical protein
MSCYKEVSVSGLVDKERERQEKKKEKAHARMGIETAQRAFVRSTKSAGKMKQKGAI